MPFDKTKDSRRRPGSVVVSMALGRAGSAVRDGIVDSLTALTRVEGETVVLVRSSVSSALVAGGTVADELFVCHVGTVALARPHHQTKVSVIMNIKKIAVAAIAISLATAGLTCAQGQRQEQGRNYNDRPGNQLRQYDRGPQRDRGHADRNTRQEDWRKGARVPSEYRNRQYVVNDWRSHNLRPPPRGYHWVQHGNDYVLAAIASGIIADILMNHQ